MLGAAEWRKTVSHYAYHYRDTQVAYHDRVPSDFGALLLKLLGERGLSLRRLAKESLKVEPPTLSGLVAGRRPVPRARIDQMVSALGLKGDQRRQFEEVALLTHAPVEIRALVAQLRAENDRLRAKLGKRT